MQNSIVSHLNGLLNRNIGKLSPFLNIDRQTFFRQTINKSTHFCDHSKPSKKLIQTSKTINVPIFLKYLKNERSQIIYGCFI